MAWLTTTLNSVKVAKVFGFKLGIIVLDDEEVSYEGQKQSSERTCELVRIRNIRNKRIEFESTYIITNYIRIFFGVLRILFAVRANLVTSTWFITYYDT